MSTQTPQKVPVGTLDVAYTASGEGEPVILVHGGESDRHQFEALRPFLGDGIRAISYDQRDSGDTVSGEEAFTISDLGDDLAGLVEALGYKKAHLLGTSYGGIVAMHAALDHPDRFQSVSVAASPPSGSFAGPGMATMIELDEEARRAYMVDMLISPQGQLDNPGLFSRARSVLTRRTPEQANRRWAAVADHDVVDRLNGFKPPLLVIHGTDDPLIGVDAAEEIARQVPGSRLELIEGGRHGIATEFPQVVGGIVREFVHTHAIG